MGGKNRLSLVVIHLLVLVECRPHRDVVTSQGTVRGYLAPRPPHYAFLGLPYARPPTARHRFKAPKPPESWTGIFEATHHVKCPQPDGTGEENCLVINVFTPQDAASSPVIVYFHDGGFQKGWGVYNGPERLLDQGFVFVTFNYRLGVFGFLCLGLDDAPGNAGLKDQVAALYWVKRNIAKFGGNPADVTVYGTGSGAVSVELLLLSGATKDLINKAILESGSVLSPSSFSNDPNSDAFDIANHLGYKSEKDARALSNFYNKLPVSKLRNITRDLLPCIENNLVSTHSLLDMDPRIILNSGKYQHVPTMIVFTNAKEVTIISEDINRFKTVPENFDNLLPNNLIIDSDEVKQKVAEIVKNFYFGEINVIQSYIDYVNDIFIEYPVIKSAVHHAINNSVFLMKFVYNGNKNEKIDVAAFDDIFRYIASEKNFDDNEEIAEKLTILLSNFIRMGDPTPIATQLTPQIWQPLIPHVVNGNIVLRNIPCLVFGTYMRNELLYGEQYIFWERIYHKFHINVE